MKSIYFYSIFLVLLITKTSFSQPWLQTGLNSGVNGTLFGTNDGYAVRHITDNQMRAFMNPNFTNSVNGMAAIPRNGFLGLGQNYAGGLGTVWNGSGPASLLHLNGPDGTFMGLLGYRNWMRNGITFTANNDMMYVGPRRNGNQNDFTDAVFSWSDNGDPGEFGPDNMVFNFITGDGTTIGAVNGDLTGTGPNGREVMRLNANGNIGMGPRFSNANQPQSQLHINTENNVPAWWQISNQNTLGGNYDPFNGFRLGIANTTVAKAV